MLRLHDAELGFVLRLPSALPCKMDDDAGLCMLVLRPMLLVSLCENPNWQHGAHFTHRGQDVHLYTRAWQHQRVQHQTRRHCRLQPSSKIVANIAPLGLERSLPLRAASLSVGVWVPSF